LTPPQRASSEKSKILAEEAIMKAKPLIVALCSSLLFAAGVSARQPGDQLTVVASPKDQATYEKWSSRQAHRLTGSVERAAALSSDRSATGYARVLFRLDEQGKPQDIALAEPSSSRSIDRISVRAVRRMGTLMPLPSSVRSDSRFEAWVVVANDRWEQQDMLTALQAGHRERTLAQAPADRPVLIAAR
jgi:TonB family protein